MSTMVVCVSLVHLLATAHGSDFSNSIRAIFAFQFSMETLKNLFENIEGSGFDACLVVYSSSAGTTSHSDSYSLGIIGLF